MTPVFRVRWGPSFPHWLAQVEVNLETRNRLMNRFLALAFHIGLSKWERIWLHVVSAESHETWHPPRQARRRAMTQRWSRFLVTKSGIHRHNVENEPSEIAAEIPVAWALARAIRNDGSPKRKRGIFCPHSLGGPGGMNRRILRRDVQKLQFSPDRDFSLENETEGEGMNPPFQEEKQIHDH